MRVLLDTDAYSALMRGQDAVTARVRQAEGVLLSAIVAGELLFGFRSGSRYARNRKDLEAFLQNPYVEFVPVTWVTAERFGRIAAALRTKGKPVPTNDIWIAAHAMETGADLLSFDQHYRHIDGIVWIDPSGE
ncbi:MAG TPA: type II toxin-antitoxin system VapC family toxin [Acidobacteriota bacterium]|jgi:tRNA(fMet)-specific endonuclease VapC|nr:type II toxin-antitoxin system VapC family toxin [Acidobacteriota bacterium]